ncbi:MAG TPA: isoleucine--tRNA ligase [Cyanobacteria bacterium UBA8803]|nr:isoleucine--tRNA ligase [Cyanobacteria bacterium UBA9273]HBL59603.1 isoleucine--tRNA ligase [Cyanobacteria bacterium UBA8803]
MTEAKTYKDTVNLPQTQFDMRANAVKREPELQKFWADHQIYERLSQNNPGDIFVLHDGPPYANGSLHIGHALNKILKDVINKYQLLQGRKVRFVPGWDCHGLPIELKVLQAMAPEERQELTPLKLRRKAQKFALKAVAEQARDFKRYGVWGDWEHPYLTLNPAYEAAQIAVFGQMVLKGYIYRGLKPVHWSPSSQTALAEAELEYPEGHTSRSLYAAFPITQASDSVKEVLEPYLPNLGVAIWTTTPWTIPGNLAVAVNPDLIYAVVEVPGQEVASIEESKEPSSETAKPSGRLKKKAKGFAPKKAEVEEESSKPEVTETPEAKAPPKGFKYLLVAAELVARLSDTLDIELAVKATVKGKELEYCTYRHPLYDRESPVVIGGDYVTTESGTGLVHTAPGHGQEDFIVGQRYGLPILSPVDEDGNFTAEAGQFARLNVLGDANQAVIEALKEAGAFLKEEAYVHKYPYDWRTKQPTIFRATEQWFASVEGFREAALEAIASVQWIPAQGQNRITPMVAERSDWCISRQRSWGVPIPVFYDEETNEPLLTAETIAHVQAIIAEQGSDAWWEMSVDQLLPEQYHNNGRTYRKGTDTMDVWFDSGSSWAAVAQQREELSYPVDMYLEGSDQHRGWFQSSLLTSVATNGIAPYKTVLTHGFVLDEQGRKMSKSVGNVVDPAIIIEGGKNQKTDPPYGADVLRLWVSSVDYSNDVPIGQNILKQLSDIYRKIRNTARFLLGNLHDFDPARDAVPYEQLPQLDRYMLHRMTEVFGEVTAAFESYQFFRFFQTVQNFCVVDLSNFYLDIAKDRLYISHPDSLRRRSCQTVLAVALENLARAIAPVLCHMAEDIWQYLPYKTPYQSVFESGWVQIDPAWHNRELAEFWITLRGIRTEVNKVLEQARANKAIGSSLEAKVLLYVPDLTLRERLQELNPQGIHRVKAQAHQPEEVAIEPPPPIAVRVEGVESASIWQETPPSPEQKQQLGESATQLLSELSGYLKVLSAGNERSLLTIGLIVAASLAVKVTLATLDAIGDLPLLPLFLKLIGLGYSAWFVKRYLLLAANRQELSEKIQSFKAEIVGSEWVTQGMEMQENQPILIEEVSASLEAKAEEVKVQEIPATEAPTILGNSVDELRYLVLASQVELVESPEVIENAEYKSQSEQVWVGVVKADGEKCDRCWNYSTQVGKIAEHPLLCDRCDVALAGEF